MTLGFVFNRDIWSFEFRWAHRKTRFSIMPMLFKPSLHRYPFVSVRFLCFWFTHDWNKFGSPFDPPKEAA